MRRLFLGRHLRSYLRKVYLDLEHSQGPTKSCMLQSFEAAYYKQSGFLSNIQHVPMNSGYAILNILSLGVMASGELPVLVRIRT